MDIHWANINVLEKQRWKYFSETGKLTVDSWCQFALLWTVSLAVARTEALSVWVDSGVSQHRDFLLCGAELCFDKAGPRPLGFSFSTLTRLGSGSHFQPEFIHQKHVPLHSCPLQREGQPTIFIKASISSSRDVSNPVSISMLSWICLAFLSVSSFRPSLFSLTVFVRESRRFSTLLLIFFSKDDYNPLSFSSNIFSKFVSIMLIRSLIFLSSWVIAVRFSPETDLFDLLLQRFFHSYLLTA